MANAILAYGNMADEALLYGGTWQGTLPLTNLQDRRLGKVARTTAATPLATQFDADFGHTSLFRVLALVNHNLSQAATYKITLSNAANFASEVVNSGWLPVWPTVYPLGALPWGAPNWWTGKYAAADIADYTGVLAYILPRSMNARYVRFELSDPTNPAGYVQAGRLFAADGWQPVRNMVYGASLAWEDPSEVQTALSGAEYFNERAKNRVARFALDAMTEDEAMAQAFDIQRRVGLTKEVLYIWDPEDTIHSRRRQFLGRLRTLSAIENPGPDRWRSPFEVKELL